MNHSKQLILFILLAFFLANCTSSSEENDKQNIELHSSTDKSETCVVTCPHCGHKKTEILPTEVCQIKYTCENCNKTLTPEGDDCCVFCSHSTHKCPSKQEE